MKGTAPAAAATKAKLQLYIYIYIIIIIITSTSLTRHVDKQLHAFVAPSFRGPGSIKTSEYDKNESMD